MDAVRAGERVVDQTGQAIVPTLVDRTRHVAIVDNAHAAHEALDRLVIGGLHVGVKVPEVDYLSDERDVETSSADAVDD